MPRSPGAAPALAKTTVGLKVYYTFLGGASHYERGQPVAHVVRVLSSARASTSALLCCFPGGRRASLSAPPQDSTVDLYLGPHGSLDVERGGLLLSEASLSQYLSGHRSSGQAWERSL